MHVTLHVNYYVAVALLALVKSLGLWDISWVWVFFPVWGMVVLLCVLLLVKIAVVGEEE